MDTLIAAFKNNQENILSDLLKVASLFNRYGLTPPVYHYHTIHYNKQRFYECMIDSSELFLQEFYIDASPYIAKTKATERFINKIIELNLLPRHCLKQELRHEA